MSVNYFIANKQEFLDHQARIEIWNQAVEAATSAFYDAVDESGLFYESMKQIAVNKLKLAVPVWNYFELKWTLIGIVWTNSTDNHFSRSFGDRNRYSVYQIWEDISKMINGDFDHYVIIDDNNKAFTWDQFEMILIDCNQDF